MVLAGLAAACPSDNLNKHEHRKILSYDFCLDKIWRRKMPVITDLERLEVYNYEQY